MKRILTITFLNYFVSGGITLTIPLLLLERNVDLAEIGIVLSVLPLVFMVVRLFLAALADLVEWTRFYLLLNWPRTLFSTFGMIFVFTPWTSVQPEDFWTGWVVATILMVFFAIINNL